MATRTITAMFTSRSEADRAAAAVHANTTLATTNVKVVAGGDATAADGGRREEGGFMNTLRNFFMPEEDRYGYAEGLRRGSTMVVAETEETHAHQVMDILEEAGAVDLDAEEAHWRSEGWKGYEPSSSATAIPPVAGTTATGAVVGGTTAAGTTMSSTSTTVTASPATTSAHATGMSQTGTAAGTGTEERIALVEETLRVGKRQVDQGRVRIRSYVVETPVTETVQLRDEIVEVERRPVDRPITSADTDLFREREIAATATGEEAVVAKEARVREELVIHKSTQEREETVHDTVRHTEVEQDGGNAAASSAGTQHPNTIKP